MKIKFTLSFILLFISITSAQNFISGAGASYLIPSGGFSNRFKPELGYNVFFGKQTSENWRWTGKFEYMDFDNQNNEGSYIKEVYEGQEYKFNLPENFMKFTAYGISANADYKIYENDFLKTFLNFGFGVYNWKFTRNEFNDSIFINSNGTNTLIFAANLPQNVQTDWSGGFNFGVNADVKLIEPLWLNIGANYKAIIGELWPALAIDMENVSTFQFIDIKASLTVKF